MIDWQDTDLTGFPVCKLINVGVIVRSSSGRRLPNEESFTSSFWLGARTVGAAQKSKYLTGTSDFLAPKMTKEWANGGEKGLRLGAVRKPAFGWSGGLMVGLNGGMRLTVV